MPPTPRITPLDPRLPLTGAEGELYTADRQFLAAVNRWTLPVNVNNSDYQPSGSKMTVGIHVSHSITMELTETVTRIGDPVLLRQFAEALMADGDYRPDWTKSFISRLRGDWTLPDGTPVGDQWVIIDNAIPDGTINLIDVRPGDILDRPWRFRINSVPRFHDYLMT